MQVVLVGDKDQLPSVGPGQVFFDLLSSHRIKAMELSTIYRQDDDSSIIPLAHEVKMGRLPADFTQNKADRSFIRCNAYQMPSVIEQIVGKAKERGFSADDFQVLAPMYRGPAGVTRLNTIIQDIMNPLSDTRKKEVEFRGEKFRIGDKVLHLVNSPENNVFNGDIGSIVGITFAKAKGNSDKVDKLTVAFDQTEVTYPRNEWDKLTLAYCTSIHKAQGSQFKMVILPMVMQYSRMLQRNLLYTAITRAKSTLILLGEQSAFEQSVKRQSVNRNTALVDRLTVTISEVQESVAKQRGAAKEVQSKPQDQPVKKTLAPEAESSAVEDESKLLNDGILTMSLVSSGQIDPMIGMGKVTPKSFTNK